MHDVCCKLEVSEELVPIAQATKERLVEHPPLIRQNNVFEQGIR